MAILAECPIWHRKRSVHHKVCAGCDDKIDKQKRNSRVRFWIAYQLDGKQRKEFVGMSVEEARDAEGKRGGAATRGDHLCRLQAGLCGIGGMVYWA